MALHGKLGNNVFDSAATANLESISFERIADIHDVSAMGDDWAIQLPGLTDFTVSAEGKSQVGLDTVALLGAGGENEISMQDGGANYTGAAILSAFTETAVVDDVITMSYTIDGNDAEGLEYSATGGATPTGSSNTIHGKHIDAEYGTDTSFTDIRGWTVTASVPLSDTTVAHATNCGRTKIAGIKTGTATVTVLTPVTTPPIDEGDIVPLKLWRAEATAATGYYTGSAVCTNIQAGISTTAEEVTVLSFTFTDTLDLATA
jgi:hypothetical protein